MSLPKVFLTLLAVSALAVPLAYGARKEVKVKDDFFKPDRVAIKKGDRVLWRWRGDNPHNVAIKKPNRRRVAVRSATKTDGKFAYKFRRVGKWRILCEIHPDDMRMKVIVRRP
jgi:plastocyanin